MAIKITTSTQLTSNLEIKVTARARDERGRFVKLDDGKTKKTFTVSSFDKARLLSKKAKESKSFKQFEGRAKYVIGDKGIEHIEKGYLVLVDTVIDSGIGDKDLAKFLLTMSELGPEGLDNFYNNYSEFLDDMYQYYKTEKDDEIISISNRKQKMHKTLNGVGNTNGFFSRAGYDDEKLTAKLTEIAQNDYITQHPNATPEQITKFMQKMERNPNFIYKNYLDNHYNDYRIKIKGKY